MTRKIIERDELNRIVKLMGIFAGNKKESIIAVEYADDTRKPIQVINWSGYKIMLQEDGNYVYQIGDNSPHNIINVRLNQRTGKLTWNVVLADGRIRDQEEWSVEERQSERESGKNWPVAFLFMALGAGAGPTLGLSLVVGVLLVIVALPFMLSKSLVAAVSKNWNDFLDWFYGAYKL